MSLAVLGLDVGGANLKAAHTAGPAGPCRSRCGSGRRPRRPSLADSSADLPPADRARRHHDRRAVRLLRHQARRRPAHPRRGRGASPHRDDPRLDDRRPVRRPSAAREPTRGRAPRRTGWRWRRSPAGSRPKGRPCSSTSARRRPTSSRCATAVPMPTGRTDPERLASGELVYTGVRRTPACALLGLRRSGGVLRHDARRLPGART